MRKNTAAVLAALMAGKAKRSCEAVWTDGTVIYSYAEPIAAPDPTEPGGFVVTEERFSVTTTVQTNGVYYGLSHVHGRRCRRTHHAAVEAAARKAAP